MRFSASLVFACLAIGVSGGPAISETYTVYECSFSISGGGGEKTEGLIAIDSTGKAFTYDTLPGSDRAVRVPVSTRNDGPNHVIYTYTFNIAHPDRGFARIDAQMRIPKAGGNSRISLRGRGYSGNPRGSGTCKLSTNARLPA